MTTSQPRVMPADEHNQTLIDNVHPSDWKEPVPQERYQLVVIGGGPAGLVAAFGAAGLGARVALVERHLLGGDCLNWGCVPSKALLRCAKAAYDARQGHRFGVEIRGEVRVDFAAVMRRMRTIRADISHHDAATRLRAAGIDVFFGEGSFEDRQTVRVGEHRLRFARCMIATGAAASLPPIPGLAEAGCLRPEQLFELTERPEHLIVLGAGPVGLEMSQAMRRLGSEVTLIDRAPRVLPREDPQAAAVLQQQLQEEGVRLLMDTSIVGVSQAGTRRDVALEGPEGALSVSGDAVLVALGRAPNLRSLALEQAGVSMNSGRIEVNDYLQTTNPQIYAIGDVASAYQFTHAADAMARSALQNALFVHSRRFSRVVVPWVTFTSPEVAHVGLSQATLATRDDVQVLTVEVASLDRARCDGEDKGFARVSVDGRGHIVACTVVAHRAGELIHEVTLAMQHGIGLGAIGQTVHAYPTTSEIIRKLGDAYNRSRLTPRRAAWIKRWLTWRVR